MGRNIRCAKYVSAVVAVAAVMIAPSASAATIQLQPDKVNYVVGEQVIVDIVVSGLCGGDGCGDANDVGVGQVSLLMTFDSNLTGDSFTLDPEDKMGLELDFFSGFAGTDSPFELFYLADAFLTTAELQALQGDSFILATVVLEATGIGATTNLGIRKSFLDVYLTDANLDTPAEIDADVQGATVCVDFTGRTCGGEVVPVPEPASLALLGLGAIAVAAGRRRHSRS